jgi:hypothetical protein
MISGICSECGTTYQVEAKGGDETWLCPQCGPSMPIDDDDPSDSVRFRPPRFHWPRVRLPLVVTQLLIVCVTFASFMGLVIRYMDNGHAVRIQPSVEVAAQPGEETDAAQADSDAEVATGEQSPTVEESDSQEPLAPSEATSAAPSSSTSPRRSMDPAIADATATQGVTPQPLAALADASTAVSSDSAATPSSDEFELPFSVVPNSQSVRSVMNKLIHLFGEQFVMQCRLIDVIDDAQGKVPHRFDVNGQSITLEDEDDVNFLRLEIVDSQGDPMDKVFVERTGELGRKLEWLRKGDWIVVSGTPGIRYESPKSGAAKWGLVLTDISALNEHTHRSDLAEPRKLAERQ